MQRVGDGKQERFVVRVVLVPQPVFDCARGDGGQVWLDVEALGEVLAIVEGLIPIMVGSGTGSEVMQRIAAPMVGGMITAPLLSMFVVPAVYLLLRRRQTGKAAADEDQRAE